MGHSIQHYTFDINKDRAQMLSIVNQDAIYESDSRSELPNHVRFLEDKIYEDIDEAHEAIEKLDRGWYDQLAVKFYDYEKVKDTKAITNLRDRIEKANEDLLDYKAKNAIKLRKSQYVGCTKCGSKINKEYISDRGYNWNKCPLCSEDLSSNTIKNSIKNKEANIKKLRANYENLRKQNAKKGKKSVKWLMKTEYHI